MNLSHISLYSKGNVKYESEKSRLLFFKCTTRACVWRTFCDWRPDYYIIKLQTRLWAWSSTSLVMDYERYVMTLEKFSSGSKSWFYSDYQSFFLFNHNVIEFLKKQNYLIQGGGFVWFYQKKQRRIFTGVDLFDKLVSFFLSFFFWRSGVWRQANSC